MAFSRRFGDLDLAPVQETGRRFVAGHPEIYVVSNVMEDGAPIGSLGAGEAVWHTDMSYLPAPPKASVLYALEVPAAGGDTWFCTMYAAVERLPTALQRRVAGLRVKHDGTYNSGGYLRQGVTPTDDPRTAPGALHPLICRHPESGRQMLYLGRRATPSSKGCRSTSRSALLDEIWAHAAPEIAWRHHWRVGDLVLWDNRAPCTAATPSTRQPRASCTARRSRASHRRPPPERGGAGGQRTLWLGASTGAASAVSAAARTSGASATSSASSAGRSTVGCRSRSVLATRTPVSGRS